jgi:type IV fimbrial biogenesis protein FimT
MRKNSGFSLMELMVAIGLISILAAIAIPNFIAWRSNAQLGRAARDVYSNFQKAKVEAARRNTVVTMTFSANDFVVYLDDGDWNYEAGEEIAGPFPWSDYPGVSLDTAEGGGDGLTFANPLNGVAFTPNGLTRNNQVPPLLSGGIVFLNNQANKKTRIVVSPSGNIRID